MRRKRLPIPYPWELFERSTTISCASCEWPTPRIKPSRRRDVECATCGAVFNSFTGKVSRPGRPVPPPTKEDLGGEPVELRPKPPRLDR